MSRAMVPGVPEVVREAVIVVAGACLAAAVLKMFPGIKAWIKSAWE